MVVNVSGWVKYHVGMKSSGSGQDTQDKDDWRLRVKGATSLPRPTLKIAIKMVLVYVINRVYPSVI